VIVSNPFGAVTTPTAILLVQSLYAWGGSYLVTNVPANLGRVTAISAGVDHDLALRTDGTVAAWGINPYEVNNVPPGASNVQAIAAGGDHNLVLKSDGTMLSWGTPGNGGVT